MKWEFSGLNGFVETKPLVVRDQVVFGAWDTFFYALKTADGALAWKWSNGSRAILYSPAACWPVAAAGKVFLRGAGPISDGSGCEHRRAAVAHEPVRRA